MRAVPLRGPRHRSAAARVMLPPIHLAMKSQIKPWMLAYTFGFGLLSVLSCGDDLANHYPFIITAWGCVCHLVIFVGNLLYSLQRVPASFRGPWKIVLPILAAQFVFSGIYDSQHGRHPEDVTGVVWIIGLLLFLPTFRAHYLIGYGKRPGVDVG
jgi:hypothetical protein